MAKKNKSKHNIAHDDGIMSSSWNYSSYSASSCHHPPNEYDEQPPDHSPLAAARGTASLFEPPPPPTYSMDPYYYAHPRMEAAYLPPPSMSPYETMHSYPYYDPGYTGSMIQGQHQLSPLSSYHHPTPASLLPPPQQQQYAHPSLHPSFDYSKVEAPVKHHHHQQPQKTTTRKQPLTAYNIFFSEQRDLILKELDAQEKGLPPPSPPRGPPAILHRDPSTNKKRSHRKVHGKISLQALTRRIGERWKALTVRDKERYLDWAHQDKMRLLEERRYERKQEERLHINNAERESPFAPPPPRTKMSRLREQDAKEEYDLTQETSSSSY